MKGPPFVEGNGCAGKKMEKPTKTRGRSHSGIPKLHKASNKERKSQVTKMPEKIPRKEYKRLIKYFSGVLYYVSPGFKTRSGRAVKTRWSEINASSTSINLHSTSHKEVKQVNLSQKVSCPLIIDESNNAKKNEITIKMTFKPLRRQIKSNISSGDTNKSKDAKESQGAIRLIKDDIISKKAEGNIIEAAFKNPQSLPVDNKNNNQMVKKLEGTSNIKVTEEKTFKAPRSCEEVKTKIKESRAQANNKEVSRSINEITDSKTSKEIATFKESVQRSSKPMVRLANISKIEEPQPERLLQGTDRWETDRSSLKFMQSIGQGMYGEVWEGLWKNSTRVAIKSLKTGAMEPKFFLAEAETMKNLSHPNLVQLYAVCTLEEPFYIVMELMDSSLFEYLQGKGKGLKLTHLIDMAAQIAAGMAYLESLNYVHRDLTARNVLVNDSNVVKIADFGLARLIKENERIVRCSSRFPIKWTAPEAANSNSFSIRSDVWSFGILLTELVTYGEKPYPSMKNEEVLQVVKRGYRMASPDNCPLPLYNIMLECWHADPTKRPTFETLQWRLEHFFILEGSEY